jgi:hypothetical protein
MLLSPDRLPPLSARLLAHNALTSAHVLRVDNPNKHGYFQPQLGSVFLNRTSYCFYSTTVMKRDFETRAAVVTDVATG